MTAVEGTTRIIRLLLHTGWRRLLLWWGACTALVVATCAGTVSLYPEASDRATYAATLGRSTATAAFNGRGYDLHTLGGIGAYEVGFLGQLFLPVAALLSTVVLATPAVAAAAATAAPSGTSRARCRATPAASSRRHS